METQKIYIKKNKTKLRDTKYPLASSFCISELSEPRLASWSTRAEMIKTKLGGMGQALGLSSSHAREVTE